MIVRNTTTKVAWSIADQWLDWQINTLFPKIMASGLCSDCKAFRLQEQDDTEGPTFTTQFFFDNTEDYETFLRSFYNPLEQQLRNLWGRQAVDFSTTMQLVN
ncbi:MAG: DUF4286 family protein [Chitinophagaceae bacterium]|nr:DUF4286 family protein [Chitinophagaceae bacterium]MCW5926079.1 DUF4286 family protein [Chitinophagaceae bacterium]